MTAMAVVLLSFVWVAPPTSCERKSTDVDTEDQVGELGDRRDGRGGCCVVVCVQLLLNVLRLRARDLPKLVRKCYGR